MAHAYNSKHSGGGEQENQFEIIPGRKLGRRHLDKKVRHGSSMLRGEDQ
jgi:hypothetical protein